MKKLIVFALLCAVVLSSCGVNHGLCPAYKERKVYGKTKVKSKASDPKGRASSRSNHKFLGAY